MRSAMRVEGTFFRCVLRCLLAVWAGAGWFGIANRGNAQDGATVVASDEPPAASSPAVGPSSRRGAPNTQPSVVGGARAPQAKVAQRPTTRPSTPQAPPAGPPQRTP